MKKEKTKKIGHKKAFPKSTKKKSKSKSSYNKLVKKYSLEIEKYKTKVNLIKNINKFAIPSILIVAIIIVLVFYKSAFIGYFAVGDEKERVSEINNLFAENSSYLLSLEKGELKSLRINGQLIGDGSAKVYLEAGNESYLIFDSNHLEDGSLTGITGLAVDELGETDETGDLNETISENDGKELNGTAPVNGSLNDTEPSNETIIANETVSADKTEDIDTIPPNPITSLQVVNKTGVIILSWTNPDDTDFAGVKALRKEDVYPDISYSKAMADSLAVDVTDKALQTTLLDDTVTANLTYYYRVYSYDKSFNYALGRGVLVTVNEIELDDNIIVNKTTPANETSVLNETKPLNETVYVNETLENITNPPEDAEILIELEYNNEGEFDTDNDGIEERDGIIDFNVNTEFNWEVNKSNLCTIWETYSINNESAVKICYGNEKCCNFVGLEPLTANWNEIFYSYYERYGATLNNKISAQVVYVDYSVNEENPYSYVYYSDWDSLNAIFIDEEKITEFNDICMETCLLSLNETSYKLRIELENANLRLDSISYTIIPEEEEKENNAPELLINIPDIIISKNSEFSIDLSEYFFDENGDSLEYTVYEMDDISALVNESIATLIPEKGFTGIIHTFIIANDSESIAVSNVFSVNVTEVLKPRNITVENVTVFNVTEMPIQLKAEVNKPVKWVKIVSAENSEAINQTINISFSLPKQAFNLAVKDIKLNKTIEQDKISIKDKIISAEEPKVYEKETNEEGVLEADEKNVEFPDLVKANEAKEYLIEYETSAPVAVEKKINSMRKQITISSDLHYTNVLAYTDIPIEVTQQKIRLYWIRNDTRELFTNVSYYDLNNNSLIDRIEWIVPGLSNQTFEVEIEVLNVQSYPTVGGNWTVMFNTTGTANLTITAINRTSYSEMYNDNGLTINDLEIFELRCGDKVLFNKNSLANNKNLYFILDNNSLFKLSEIIGKELKIKSLFVKNYYCNSTGYHTVKVLTPGEHNQEFKFNDKISYAHNFATDLIKASTLYYEFNCPKCELDYDSSPVNFCPMINHVQERDDFEAELSFNITYVEQVNSASICAYERYSWNGEPAINYIEKINSSELSPAPVIIGANELWINKIISGSVGWKCINITPFVKDSIDNNEDNLYLRWWGHDMDGERGPFACFKGFAPLDECDGNNPSGALDCRPYLNIT